MVKVYAQGRTNLLKSGHVTVTKIENVHRSHIQNSQILKMLSFESATKNNEVIAEKPFRNSGVTRHLWTLGRLELTLVVNTVTKIFIVYNFILFCQTFLLISF